MGFFRKIFGNDHSAQPVVAPEPPQTHAAAKIHYDPELVNGLLAEHSRLGGIFARIGQLAEEGKDDEVRTTLTMFKTSLQAHILTENVRFYAYLEQSLASSPEDVRTFHEFRRDMNTIARGVVAFVKKWQLGDFSSISDRQQFLTDYHKVGELLEQRLDSEENSLYPLYQPS